MRIGLTGGIGCGKSSAGKLFTELGWERIDSDAIVRELLHSDIALHAAAIARWGKEAILPDEGVNRSFVAHKVFNNKDELRWWEEQLLPKVRRAWLSEISANHGANWIVEVPLLFEKQLEGNFHHIICVEAPENVQLARLAAKGLDREQSLARINNQMPVKDKVRRSDIVLSNAGSFDFLQRQVYRASEMLQKLS